MGISKYIFSFSLIFILSFSSFGQDENLYVKKKEKEPLKLLGFKAGVNAGRFADYLFKPERVSYEGSFDFNLSNKYFGLIEGGYSEINLEKENYSYNLKGPFFKVGFDYNMLKKVPSDFLGVGLKVGWTNYSQYADNILIEFDKWPDLNTSIPSRNYNKVWTEISFGIKGEIFKNVYLGWSALIKISVAGDKNEGFQPYDIPGFGKGKNLVNMGANYYIYYQFPVRKQ